MEHTDARYDQQLATLREALLLMAGRVEAMIAASVKALLEQDTELARRTIDEDHKVNRAEMETDQLCLVILARRQPMASDLRFITLCLKMVTDLERIGDLAVNICERTIDLSYVTPLDRQEAIQQMSDLARSMVRDAIDAFVARDEAAARAVIARDDAVDKLYVSVFGDTLERMRRDDLLVTSGIHLLSVAKWLERIADHATNLAEQVVFLVRGTDIRHAGKV